MTAAEAKPRSKRCPTCGELGHAARNRIVHPRDGEPPPGSVHRNGNGYRWELWKGGRMWFGATLPTEAEAYADLEAFRSDPQTAKPKARWGGPNRNQQSKKEIARP